MAGMQDTSDQACARPHSQASNAATEPVTTPDSSNVRNSSHAVGPQEEVIIKSTIDDPRQDFKQVNQIFDSNPSLVYNASGIKNGRGNTLLHAVVTPYVLSSHMGIETRHALLAAGADLGAQNNDGDTPFHLAANYWKSDDDVTGMGLTALQELLGLSEEAPHHERTQNSLSGAIDKRNNDGDTVLHIMASKNFNSLKNWEELGIIKAVDQMLFVCSDALVSTDKVGNTPLHRALLESNSTMVDLLLKAHHGDQHIVSIKNTAGDFPLHLAVRQGWMRTVEELMAAHEPDEPRLIRNGRGETPLHIAAHQGNTYLVPNLLKGWSYEEIAFADDSCGLRDQKGMTPLHIAAGGTGDTAIKLLELMLNGCTGPKVLNEVEEEMGWAPLHFAASKGHERIVELLLLNGADSKLPDKENLLAVDIARRENHVEVADFLQKYRTRSFRPSLEPNEENAKADNHFLALSWPRWDQAVRQQRGGDPRRLPHLTPVYQLIFNSKDIYYKIGMQDSERQRIYEQERLTRRYSGGQRWVEFLEESARSLGKTEAICLAPIHQNQIRLSSCVRKGWIIAERHELLEQLDLAKMEEPRGPMKNGTLQAYIWDSNVFQDMQRSTRWIHFPVNNVSTGKISTL